MAASGSDNDTLVIRFYFNDNVPDNATFDLKSVLSYSAGERYFNISKVTGYRSDDITDALRLSTPENVIEYTETYTIPGFTSTSYPSEFCADLELTNTANVAFKFQGVLYNYIDVIKVAMFTK